MERQSPFLREFDLLYELMKKPGRVLTREMLLERVWKTEFFGDTRTVDVHIRYLRQKLRMNRIILNIS